jgi:hypothetical protein
MLKVRGIVYVLAKDPEVIVPDEDVYWFNLTVISLTSPTLK